MWRRFGRTIFYSYICLYQNYNYPNNDVLMGVNRREYMYQNRIIIAGSRSVNENDTNLIDQVQQLLTNIPYEEIEIVSGTAKGADRLGENFAKQNSIPLKQLPADWKTYGKKAGYIRNKQMAEYATHLIAIWDGQSKGTRHMIDLAREYGLKIKIISLTLK